MTKTELTVDALRDFLTPIGASFGVLLAYFDGPGFTRYVTWGDEPIDKVAASDLCDEIQSWVNAGGSKVMLPSGVPATVLESFKLDAARNKHRADAAEEEVKRLLAFKQYVHERLDAAGVSADPESPHRAEGCRIGGRLDEVFAERDSLRVRVARLEAIVNQFAKQLPPLELNPVETRA